MHSPKTYVIASPKPWHAELASRLSVELAGQWHHAATKQELETLAGRFAPRYVFFPHWSEIIPEPFFTAYECVVFHMTDLPYGRGGSPLQNLIVRGHTSTRLSALRVAKGLDTGPVYLKRDLSLLGSAEEIFLRASEVIEEMIQEIVAANPEPVPQVGEPVVFKRRTPPESSLSPCTTLHQVYDYIRMLDAEGYPHAFVEVGGFRYEFRRATLRANGTVQADVTIRPIEPTE